MKKKLFFLAAAAFAAMTINATDLWTGSKHVSWSDGGLQIAASAFADAQAGQKIVVHFTDASDGMEFKVMNEHFDHLAGSREALWISGNSYVEQFLTAKAVEELKAYGLEIIGANFTCTKVELADGKELKEGITVWTGFFWADEWSTLELYWNGYRYVDFNDVKAIRFYSEAAGTDYVLNFRKGWGEGEKFADQGAMTDGAGYKEFALTNELRTAMADAEHWMVQFNKEGLDPFNVTDIVLVMHEPYTRTVTNGNYGTICLPRASAAIEGATIYHIVDGDEAGITIEEVDAMEAGVPYIFQATADQLTVTMTGASSDVQETNGLVGYLGTGTTAVPQNGHCYVLSGNQLYLVNSDVTIATNRAYVDLTAISTLAPAPGRVRRVINTYNQATALDKTDAQLAPHKVLLNGQLLIVRDGQLFDISGVRVQ